MIALSDEIITTIASIERNLKFCFARKGGERKIDSLKIVQIGTLFDALRISVKNSHLNQFMGGFMRYALVLVLLFALHTITLAGPDQAQWTNGTSLITKIEVNTYTNIITITTSSPDTFYYWYNCQYGQCYNGNNTPDAANKFLATLLNAKNENKSVDFLYYSAGGKWVGGIRVSY